jgi:hypothetical protein
VLQRRPVLLHTRAKLRMADDEDEDGDDGGEGQ